MAKKIHDRIMNDFAIFISSIKRKEKALKTHKNCQLREKKGKEMGLGFTLYIIILIIKKCQA